jgi:hypothetical protein
MGKAEDRRTFNRFVGETVKEYIQKVIDEKKADKSKKKSWGEFFKNVFDKEFNNIAMAKYKEIMKDYEQPKEGENMNEFIKNNFDDDKFELYKRVKDIRYTAPDGKSSSVKENYFTTLTDEIVGYVTNDTPPTYIIRKDSVGMNDYLTNIYKAINKKNDDDLKGIRNLEDVYRRMNNAIQQHRLTDERNSAKRLKREVKKAEEAKDNERMEALAEKEREHEEDKRKLRREHYNDKHAAVKNEKERTEARVRKEYEQPYKDEFIDDDREDKTNALIPYDDDREDKTNALIPYDERSEEVMTEEDKTMKNAGDIHRRLQEDTLITRAATDNTFYNQLPDEIKQSLRPKIEEKKAIIERSKVIRYLLPKERPKWSNATMSKGVNPLLSRGAWGI